MPPYLLVTNDGIRGNNHQKRKVIHHQLHSPRPHGLGFDIEDTAIAFNIQSVPPSVHHHARQAHHIQIDPHAHTQRHRHPFVVQITVGNGAGHGPNSVERDEHMGVAHARLHDPNPVDVDGAGSPGAHPAAIVVPDVTGDFEG